MDDRLSGVIVDDAVGCGIGVLEQDGTLGAEGIEEAIAELAFIVVERVFVARLNDRVSLEQPPSGCHYQSPGS